MTHSIYLDIRGDGTVQINVPRDLSSLNLTLKIEHDIKHLATHTPDNSHAETVLWARSANSEATREHHSAGRRTNTQADVSISTRQTEPQGPAESSPLQQTQLGPDSDAQDGSQSSSPPVSPTPSQLAIAPSIVKALFLRLPEVREFMKPLDTSPPSSPASSESVLPASSPLTQPGTPTQRQHSRSPVTFVQREGSAPNSPRRRSGSVRTPSKSPSPHWQLLELSPTLCQRQPSPSPAPVQAVVDGSDTEEENDHFLNAYMLGCADGRAEVRNDALRLAGVEGTQETARAVAARVLGIDLDEADAIRLRSPWTYVPFPNARQGCPLTPRTRKRLKPEVPPSPVLRERMKRFKEEHGIGELELALE